MRAAEGIVVGLLVSVPTWALIWLAIHRAPGVLVTAGLVLLFVGVVGIFSRGAVSGRRAPSPLRDDAAPTFTRWE